MATLISSHQKEKPFSELDIQRCRDLNQWIASGEDPVVRGVLKGIKAMGFDLNIVTFSHFQPDDSSQEIVSFISESPQIEYTFYYNYRDSEPDAGKILDFKKTKFDQKNKKSRAALSVKNENET